MMKNCAYFFILTYWLGGGTERVFEHTAKALHGNNAKVFLFVIHGFDEQKYVLEPYVRIVRTRRELKGLVKKHDAVIINFSGDWKSGLCASWFSRGYISWVHCNPHTMRDARTGRLNFHILRKSQRIVCVCNEQKEILQSEFGFKNDITVIYNSVDIARAQELAEERLDFEGKYFLMVARLDCGSKDFFTVMDAYRMLPVDMQSECRLVFLGDGKDRELIEQYAEQKGLEGRVVFPGFDTNPYKWLRHAVCNILSSRTEGFALSVIEGMAVGCPQILTDYRTGAREVSCGGKNTLLVETGNAAAMARAMRRIAEERGLAETMVRNAAAFVQGFSQPAFAQNILAFFGGIA